FKEPIFFTRTRSLSFPVVVSTILNLFKESVAYNISTILPSLSSKAVTGAAFSKARYKISLSFFKDLNKILADYHKHNPSQLWRGYQLIAGDGSTVGLPPSRQIKSFFGIYSEKGGSIKSCLAQIFMFYDVFSGAILSKRISKMEHTERTLFNACLEELPACKSIVILDRGFGYFHIFKNLYTLKQDFCIRISSAQSCFAKRIAQESENDVITEWYPSPKEIESCLKHGLDTKKITVRVTKIELKTGEIEVLVSSLLDMNDVCTENMKALYGLRWPVEEGFKKLKPKMKLEQFGARKPDGIFQEFEAHVFMMNLVALFGIQAQQEIDKDKKRRLKYKYNWQNAFRFVRKVIIQILNTENPEHIIQSLIKLIASSKIPIKPDRSFPRITFKKRKNRLHQTYK
ncbi:IS4 family transposase, partial [Pedobacter sp. N23S346]|uniref:IS4 family transposase n=1 Tax=Pedobacter sp. N23S346 TaxID=3402750 RepID=UPI003ACF1DF0